MAVLHVSAVRRQKQTEVPAWLALYGMPSVVPDVGTDLLAMCQRNVALNSHLTASGGEAQQVSRLGGRCLFGRMDKHPRPWLWEMGFCRLPITPR